MLARSDLRGVADPTSALAPPPDDPGPVEAVREVLAAVRDRGDAAVRDFTERFDGCRIDDLRVPTSALTNALAGLAVDVRRALDRAHGEIAAYHSAQRDDGFALDRGGIRLTERVVPVRRAGCYVPGGRATYPSTVLMTAVPAQDRRGGRDRAVRPAGARRRGPAGHPRGGRSRRGRRGVPGRWRPGDRRAGLRHRVDPPRST